MKTGRFSLPKELGLLAPKALFCWEKSPLLVPVPVLPNRLVEVPLAAPKPKPVLVDEVAGWLNVLDPKSPPGGATAVLSHTPLQRFFPFRVMPL